MVDETEGGGWQDMLASRRGVLRGGGSRVEEGGVLEADIPQAGSFEMVAAESHSGKEQETGRCRGRHLYALRGLFEPRRGLLLSFRITRRAASGRILNPSSPEQG